MKSYLGLVFMLPFALSCSSSDRPANGVQRCAVVGETRCPSGFECVDDHCWLTGSMPMANLDAAPLADTLPPDVSVSLDVEIPTADSSSPDVAIVTPDAANTCLLGTPGNCGECGITCRSEQTCQNGLCCGMGLTNCGGRCVDLTTDTTNCGVCAKACASSSQCKDRGCRAVDGQPCVTGPDCLSGTCTSFYKDDDGDTYGSQETAGRCTVTEAPSGYSKRSGDCCDLATTEAIRVVAANIHPSATWQTRSAGGVCGVTWDYNCDGKVVSSSEQRYGCANQTAPCDAVLSRSVQPTVCGTFYFDCGECKVGANGSSCVYDPNGNCVDGTGVWECR